MSTVANALGNVAAGTVGTVTLFDVQSGKDQLIALGGSILFQAILLGFKELKKLLTKRKEVKQAIEVTPIPTPTTGNNSTTII